MSGPRISRNCSCTSAAAECHPTKNLTGTSVTLSGEQRYLDSHLSYQRACLHAIDYLTKFGYSPEQAYLLLGSAPIEGRISGVVDIPNACCSLYLPTAMFDFDITPNGDGPTSADRGTPAATS